MYGTYSKQNSTNLFAADTKVPVRYSKQTSLLKPFTRLRKGSYHYLVKYTLICDGTVIKTKYIPEFMHWKRFIF